MGVTPHAISLPPFRDFMMAVSAPDFQQVGYVGLAPELPFITNQFIQRNERNVAAAPIHPCRSIHVDIERFPLPADVEERLLALNDLGFDAGDARLQEDDVEFVVDHS